MENKYKINRKLYDYKYVSEENINKELRQLNVPDDLVSSVFQGQRDFVLAIRKNELAGIAMLCDRNKSPYNPIKDVTSLSYIKVSENHKHKGVGINLLEETIKTIQSKNHILRRTEPTDDGKMFIFDKFTNMLNNANVNYIPDNLFFIYDRLDKKIFNNADYSNIEKIKKMNEVANALLEHDVCKKYDINKIEKLNGNFLVEADEVIDSIKKEQVNPKKKTPRPNNRFR